MPSKRTLIANLIAKLEGHICHPMLQARVAFQNDANDEDIVKALQQDISHVQDIVDEAENMLSRFTWEHFTKKTKVQRNEKGTLHHGR